MAKVTGKSEGSLSVAKAAFDRVAGGVKFVAMLVAATAVISVLKNAVGLAPSKWLSAWLEAYARLMHPIVDATLGTLLGVVGVKLLPAGKDTAVIYTVCGLTVSRGMYAIYHREMPSFSLRRIGHFGWRATIWPKVLLQLVRGRRFPRRPYIDPAHPDAGLELMTWKLKVAAISVQRIMLRDIGIEALVTALIIVAVVVANEAGVLK